ncbi:MAG TPA: anti-sigma factor [Terracidiphilus sp.]|nr:anti-sigma factor [Terracidiphilus sp.]
MMDGGHIAQEDLALFAMHSCSEEESAAVRSHVKECAACRSELEKVSGDLAVVAMSVELHPLPEGARQRFIERISAAPVAMERGTQAPVISIRKEQTARRPLAWIPWAAAAALAFVAVSLAVEINSLNHRLQSESNQLAELAAANAHAQEVLEVLTAPAAQRVVLTAGKAAPAPSARAVYLPARGALIFQASNMGPLPENKAYELWVIPANGKAPIPAGLFWPDATGSASLVLPPLPVGVEAKAFGVTIERAEGSATPTSPIVLAGAAPTS